MKELDKNKDEEVITIYQSQKPYNHAALSMCGTFTSSSSKILAGRWVKSKTLEFNPVQLK